MTAHDFPTHPGLFKVRIQLTDDNGAVSEFFEASEHVCEPTSCESPAHCETCGITGDKMMLVIGSTEDGMDIFTCYPCLATDSYAQTEADPDRCPNSWHRTNDIRQYRPCPECPARS